MDKQLVLYKHNYKYFPYEDLLAEKEIQGVLQPQSIFKKNGIYELTGKFKRDDVRRLVYFSKAQLKGEFFNTLQFDLEQNLIGKNLSAKKRQSTRYSVHGLHEYKGKFNPQVARVVLNLFNIKTGGKVLDPFCGSGTTLVECCHLGVSSVGWDVNPLAIYIAQSKIKALNCTVKKIKDIGEKIIKELKRIKTGSLKKTICGDREKYLLSWFPKSEFLKIEGFREIVENTAPRSLAPVFFCLMSDLLREYSLQEPADLRIRRRRSPYPERPIFQAFEDRFQRLVLNLGPLQKAAKFNGLVSEAILFNSRENLKASRLKSSVKKFDCAVTSPPYAMALPYIDTQRLSLVWLGLCEPKNLLGLESSLIGSREIRGSKKRDLIEQMMINSERLPTEIHQFCLELYKNLSKADGFRRQAVPILLYRYFSGMQNVFINVRAALKKNSPFALIVGHNHTTINGRKFEINTPSFLSSLAKTCGWGLDEDISLQTYQRYGLHHSNSVGKESLLIVRKQ